MSLPAGSAEPTEKPHNPGHATPAGLTRDWFGLVRFRSPLLTESRLLSLPAGNEMFHFPAFPPLALCVQARVTGHDSSRVSPFGNPRITARLPAPRGLSQAPTSFIGSWCQDIHRMLLKTWPQMLASTVQFSNNDQPPVTTRRSRPLPGPATEEKFIPSDTQQRARHPRLSISRSTPKQY